MRLYLFRKARQQSSCSAFDKDRFDALLAGDLSAPPSTRAWQFFSKNWSAEL